MITALAMASVLALTPASTHAFCDDRPGPAADDELRRMYEGGRDYTEFLDAATRRAELWHGNTEVAQGIDPALVTRARAVGGTWHLLAVAIDACSDSVNTIPYLAQLVSMVDGLEMRIVDSTVGRSVMEAHPTPDGRPATPTVVLLDEEFEERGCFIERPPTLQTWILENDGVLSSDDIYEQKMAWYEDDSGSETVETFVEMLEAAAAGRTICG